MKIKKFESFDDDDTVEFIGHDEYLYYRDKKYYKPTDEAIDILKDEILKFLTEYDREYQFNDDKFSLTNNRITFNGNPIYGPTDPDLKLSMVLLDDDWYLLEVYFNWCFYTILCDDIIGLKKLSSSLLDKIETDLEYGRH